MSNKINDYVKDIKAIQDILRKDSLQEYYRYAILGFTVLRRLMQTLEPTQADVDAAYAEMKQTFVDDEDNEARKTKIDVDRLMSASGLGFYNVSGMKFDKNLASDPQKVFANVKTMINSFSDNVASIFAPSGLNLVATASAINDKKALSGIINKFAKLDFSPAVMSNSDMGVLFGELKQMVYGTVENGENFTPADFSNLLTKLLLAEGCEQYKTGTHEIKLLDNCCGTSSMLTHCEREIKKLNPNNDVLLYGQDNSGLNIAVCKAEQLMMGQEVDNFRLGDTLVEDCFKGIEFDLGQQNAPYGCGRKKADEETIKALLGGDLPGSEDNQMLFWKAALRKIKLKGRLVLLSNGSPLFKGSTLSGESKIRKWLLDNDYVEAIIKLTDQGFIDTGITIYAWVLSKGGKKGTRRENVIQLINAESFFHPLKKGIGMKRKEMTEEDVDNIVKLYTDFPKTNVFVKNVTKEQLYYYEVAIQQPYQRNFMISEERIANLYSELSFNKLYDEEDYLRLLDEPATEVNLNKLKEYKEGKVLQEHIISTLSNHCDGVVYRNKNAFESNLKDILSGLKPAILKGIINALSEKDKVSDQYTDKKSVSGLLADSDLNDVEYIPCDEDIQKYFDREVKPFAPDAWYIFDRNKCGCEINFNKYFYKYVEPESSDTLLTKLKGLNDREQKLMGELLK